MALLMVGQAHPEQISLWDLPVNKTKQSLMQITDMRIHNQIKWKRPNSKTA